MVPLILGNPPIIFIIGIPEAPPIGSLFQVKVLAVASLKVMGFLVGRIFPSFLCVCGYCWPVGVLHEKACAEVLLQQSNPLSEVTAGNYYNGFRV